MLCLRGIKTACQAKKMSSCCWMGFTSISVSKERKYPEQSWMRSIVCKCLKFCRRVWYLHSIIIGIQLSALKCYQLSLYHCILKWRHSPYHPAAWNRCKEKLEFLKELLRRWLLCEMFPRSRTEVIRFPNSSMGKMKGGEEAAGTE